MADFKKSNGVAIRNGGPNRSNGNTNGNTTTAAAAKKASARVKDLVDFDEKKHMDDIRNDIKHGVVHGALNELEERVNDLGESWETESLFEDALDDLAEDKFFTDSEFLDLLSLQFALGHA